MVAAGKVKHDCVFFTAGGEPFQTLYLPYNRWREVMETQHRQAGQITFVYMPSHFHFLAHDSASFEALERKVVTLWSGLGVDYISLTALLEATENPLAYYSHDGHLNEKGYELTGEAIIEHLRLSAGE